MEIPVTYDKEHFTSSFPPAGVDIIHKAVIFNHVSDKMGFAMVNVSPLMTMACFTKWASVWEFGIAHAKNYHSTYPVGLEVLLYI